MIYFNLQQKLAATVDILFDLNEDCLLVNVTGWTRLINLWAVNTRSEEFQLIGLQILET